MTRTSESHRHTASVHRSEAAARRLTQPDFAAVLDQWAANAERRAVEAENEEQPDLFAERKAA